MDHAVSWFATTFGNKISAEAVTFIVSLLPILECRGGLLLASMLKVNLLKAIPLVILGNILPMPFVLLFMRHILNFMRRFSFSRPLVEWLEKRAQNKSASLKRGEFWGLLLFVGIPLPGTGGWTGALVASLMEMDFKKAMLAISLGVLLATFIMSVLSYGLLGLLFH